MSIFLVSIIVWVIKIGLFALGVVLACLGLWCLKNAFDFWVSSKDTLFYFSGYLVLGLLSFLTFTYLFTTEISYIPL